MTSEQFVCSAFYILAPKTEAKRIDFKLQAENKVEAKVKAGEVLLHMGAKGFVMKVFQDDKK